MPVTAVVTRDDSSGAPTTLETYAAGVKFLIHDGNLEIISAGSQMLGMYGSGNWLSVYIDDKVQVFSGDWQKPSVSLGHEPAPEPEPHVSLPGLSSEPHVSMPGLASASHVSLPNLSSEPHVSVPGLSSEPHRSLRGVGSGPGRSVPGTAPSGGPDIAARYASTPSTRPGPPGPARAPAARRRAREMPSHMTRVAFGPKLLNPPPPPPPDEPTTSRFINVAFGPRPVKKAEPPAKPEKAKRFQIVSFSRTYSAPGQPVRPPAAEDSDDEGTAS